MSLQTHLAEKEREIELAERYSPVRESPIAGTYMRILQRSDHHRFSNHW